MSTYPQDMNDLILANRLKTFEILLPIHKQV